MATLQQSTEINVEAGTVYNWLTRFDNYPRFMQDIESVRQTGETQLHWNAKVDGQNLEWDTNITVDDVGFRIAWRSAGGPADAWMLEIQPLDSGASRITMIFESGSDPHQMIYLAAGVVENEMEQRLKRYMAQLKDVIESQTLQSSVYSSTHQSSGEGRMHSLLNERHSENEHAGVPGNASVPMPGYAARPEVLTNDENHPLPILSRIRIAEELGDVPKKDS